MSIGKEEGISLVELLIGISLLAVIGLMTSKYFNRIKSSEAELHAKDRAVSELARITGFIKRDLDLRDIRALTPLCVDPICREFTITRFAPNSNATATYDVTYSSSCQPMQQKIARINNLSFSAASLENLTNAADSRTRCLQTLNCGAGTYPSVSIQVNNPPPAGPQPMPRYPARLPEVDNSAAAFTIVGMAICATTTTVTGVNPTANHRDRVIIEAAFLGSENVIRVERKETNFVSRSTTNLQLLPR